MQSGLLLAKSQRLTLSEIITTLDLNASRLVTLSACETGLTDVSQSPDEYLGLPAGLLQAGAPTVVSSLWAVGDLSTTLLTQRFYRNLLGQDGAEPMSPASALRAAQRWLRNATTEQLRQYGGDLAAALETAASSETPFSHPFHWAAFTVAGA